MSTILIFAAGILFLAGVLWLKSRANSGVLWRKIVNWAVYALWFGITMMGVSFIYINTSVGHVKATSTAVFVFLGASVVLVLILARLLGFLSAKNTASAGTD
jgi:FtsH-binding integral membrane protein